MKAEEGREVFLLGLSHALVHGYMLIYPAVLVLIMKEFRVGYFLLGLLGTISNFAFGLGALPAGFLSDRLGARRLIFLYLVGSSLSALLISLSTTFLQLALGLGLLGLFCSLYHPCSLALLSHFQERGKAFGIVGALGNIGLALSPLLAGYLASLRGWRSSFPSFSLVGLLLALAYLIHGRKLGIGGEGRHRETLLTPAREDNGFLTPALILLVCIQMLAGFSFQGATTFLPTYLGRRVEMQLLGLDPVRIGGLMASISLIIGVIGQYLGGYWGQKSEPERLYLFLITATLPSLLAVGSSRNAILVLSAATFAFFYFFAQPVGNILLASLTSASARGRGYGISFFFSFGIGSMAASFCGLVAEKISLSAVFYCLSLVNCLQVALAIVLRGMRRKAPSSLREGR